MAANYGRTKPVDPIWYRAERSLIATCSCGRRIQFRIGDLAKKHRLDRNLCLYQVVDRLRCSACGKRGPAISLPE